MRQMIVVRPDGSTECRPMRRCPELDEIRAVVDGDVEVLGARWNGRRCEMLVNDDGVRRGLPPNYVASSAFWKESGMREEVRGTVIILDGLNLV